MNPTEAPYELISRCRSCGGANLPEILALGRMPLADALLTKDMLALPEPTYPLTVSFCADCSLVQIQETVPPGILFNEDYPYYSSFSDTLLEHSRRNVEALISSRGLGRESLAVELASNDGYLLQFFAKAGIPVLGIDPAPGPARAATERGIATLTDFFDLSLARRLRRDGVRADVIIGNNVLAHVTDQNQFVAGIAHLMKKDAVAVVEVPYIRDLIDNCEFDTIYHEHHCYFSVTSLVGLFERHGLRLIRVEHHVVHGGSLRCFFSSIEPADESVIRYLDEERIIGLTDLGYYQAFANRVESIKRDLVTMLDELKAKGHTIAAYGAAAKGATMLNYIGVDGRYLDFVVDRNVHKQGKFMPGVHIPIHAPAALLETRPDFVLILAWNFKEEIAAQQAEYLDLGGRFILPVPAPSVMA